MTLGFLRLRNATVPTAEDAIGFASPRQKQYFRSIWISDTHLGIPESKADILYDFLKHTESDYLYLVGDIVDCWRLRKGWYWPQIYNNVIRTVLGKAKNGTSVTYIPGNHDELFREFTGMRFGDIQILRDSIHTTADGRRMLVMHGDEFDSIVRHQRWLALIGSTAYEVSLKVNRWFNAVRRRLGFPYWSLSAYLKHKVKNAVKFMDNFEQAVAREARKRKLDGLICGHIHRASLGRFEDIAYCNDGDWVESCTALVEYEDGSLAIINWLDEMGRRQGEEEAAPGARLGRLVATG